MSLVAAVRAEIATCFEFDDKTDNAPKRLADRLDAMVDELQRRYAEGEFTREQLCTLVVYAARVTAWGLRDGHVPDIGESNPTLSLAQILDGEIQGNNWDMPSMEHPRSNATTWR